MAVARRRPAPGLVHHSDQGSQYVSLAFGQAAGDAGIARSMGSKGCCFDNAVADSFFATLKKKLVHRSSWPTRRELTGEVFEYIEAFYNPVRRYSTLGYLSPVQFETGTLRAGGARDAASRLPITKIRKKNPESSTLSGETGAPGGRNALDVRHSQPSSPRSHKLAACAASRPL